MTTIAFQPEWSEVKKYLYSAWDLFLIAIKKQQSGDDDAFSSVVPGLTDLPQSFRDYVAADRPGHNLLGVKGIERYLRSVALSTSRGGEEASSIFFKLSSLGRELQSILQGFDLTESPPVVSLHFEFVVLRNDVESKFRSEQQRHVVYDLDKLVSYLVELEVKPALFEVDDRLMSEIDKQRGEEIRKQWISRLERLIVDAQYHLSPR